MPPLPALAERSKPVGPCKCGVRFCSPCWVILIFVSLVFLGPGAHAQSTSAVQIQRDPRAISILSAYVAASGAGAASVTDFVASGTVTYFQAGKKVQAPVKVEGLGAIDFRLDAQLPNGTRSWSVSQAGGKLQKTDGTTTRMPWSDAVHLLCATWPVPYVVAALNSASTSITLVKQTTFAGQPAYDVRIEQVLPASIDPRGHFSKLSAKHIFIDARSYLALGTQDWSHSKFSSRPPLKQRFFFSGYREVDGIAIPYDVTETIAGQRTWSLQLSSISFDTGLTPANFTL